MAFLIPGRLCYLANPRTASHSMVRAFSRREFPGLRKHAHHSTLDQIDGYAGEPAFTVVRNPYDVLASWWVRMAEDREWAGGFAGFLRTCEDPDFVRGGRLLYCCGEGVEALRFEHLQEDLDALLDRVGVPRRTLGHDNPTSSKRPWRTYYGPEETEAANLRFGAEVVMHGYALLDPAGPG